MQLPYRKSALFRRVGRADADSYLTAAAIAKLRRNLEDIEKNQRPKAVEDMTRSREMGDLSENAAYHEAKSLLARLDGRIFNLKERLKQAILIEPGSGPGGRVSLGSTVVVTVNGTRRTYQILGSQETSPAAGRISHLSPLGAALLGHAADDTVTVKTQDREITYRIEEVT